MEESPNGMLSSQVQIIGWDMNSPQTTKISPRSVILPRPAGESSSSPSGVYFIEQWGTHQRNKRRIRRPPKPNLYKRYDFTSALDSPEISDSSDFDDFSDDVLSQIRLTPLLNKANNTCSTAAASGEVSPTGPGPSHMPASKVPQVFKTPTMFKTQSRASHEQTKVQPRKLTAEFDNAKSPVQPARSSKQPATNFSKCPQKKYSNLNNPGPPNKPVFINKPSAPGTASRPVSCSNPEIDDEDMISDDDDEVLRQADLIYASQSSQNSKVQDCSKDKHPLRNERPPAPDCQPSKPLKNTCYQSEQNKYKQTVSCQPAKTSPDKSRNICAVENKENSMVSEDEFSDDSFDDLEIDEDVLKQITSQNTKSKEIPNLMRTPPKVASPNHKKQRLSLSLNKNKGKTR